MFTILFAYIILIGFFVVIERLRKGQEAKTFDAGQFDRGSTRLIGLALLFNVIILIAANAFNYFQIGAVNDIIGWVGIAIMFCGITLRCGRSRRSESFTRVRYASQRTTRSFKKGRTREYVTLDISESYWC